MRHRNESSDASALAASVGGRTARCWPRAAALVATLALVSGCTTGFVYNRLDRVAYWYLSRQVTLSETQGDTLREDLRELLHWHRRAELPRYAAALEALSVETVRPVGRERIERARLEAESLWRDLVRQAGPQLARWLGSLSDAQVDELLGNLAQDDAKLRKEFCEADPERLKRRRERALIRGIEDWTGNLSRDQLTIVRATARQLVPTGCEWVQNQQLFRRELRRLLERRSTDPAFAAAVSHFLLTPEERWTEAYRAGFLANREQVITLLADIDSTLSPRQRARLSGRFAELARDLRDLARARSGDDGELGDGHDVLGRVRGSRVPDVPRESVPADPF